MEKSQKEKLKRNNEVEELIYRNHTEKQYVVEPFRQQAREKYPWEEEYIGTLHKITKEYFRCRGRVDNSEIIRKNHQGIKLYYHDCGGIEKHSLPIREEKEFIYPILIDLLNYVQLKTQKRVVITCGHRCPKHNVYATEEGEAKYSKHMVGAEVDFYVEGMEKKPREIAKILTQYYLEEKKYQNQIHYQHFVSSSNKKLHNKEIEIRISDENENRDFDNKHGYPYLTIEVLYDFDQRRRVHYNWNQAFNGYLRW